MRKSLILYVKSEKIPIIQHCQGISGHPCTGAYRVGETIYNYTSEDKAVIDLLEEAKIAYELVDLSDCPFSVQLKAKILGINKTPTLLLNNRKIKGVQNIKQALHQIKG